MVQLHALGARCIYWLTQDLSIRPVVVQIISPLLPNRFRILEIPDVDEKVYNLRHTCIGSYSTVLMIARKSRQSVLHTHGDQEDIIQEYSQQTCYMGVKLKLKGAREEAFLFAPLSGVPPHFSTMCRKWMTHARAPAQKDVCLHEYTACKQTFSSVSAGYHANLR